MHSTVNILVAVLMVTTVSATYPASIKLRRDGLLNLYSFPRVGRSSLGWQPTLDELLYEHKPLRKRLIYGYNDDNSDSSRYLNPQTNYLYPGSHSEFGTASLYPESSRNADTSSLWTLISGKPRSRLPKREAEKENDTNNMWFGPRLGRSGNQDHYDTERIPNRYQNNSRPEEDDRRKRT